VRVPHSPSLSLSSKSGLFFLTLEAELSFLPKLEKATLISPSLFLSSDWPETLSRVREKIARVPSVPKVEVRAFFSSLLLITNIFFFERSEQSVVGIYEQADGDFVDLACSP